MSEAEPRVYTKEERRDIMNRMQAGDMTVSNKEVADLSLIHISEPTRRRGIWDAVVGV